MFSGLQAQAHSPWGQKNTRPGTFGAGGAQNATPSTPAHAQPSNWLQTQSSPAPNATLGTPGAPPAGTGLLGTPQQGAVPPSLMGMAASQPAFGSPMTPSHGHPGVVPGVASPSDAHASPMSQAPVAYLPGYLSKMRGSSDRAGASAHRSAETTSPVVKAEADTSLLSGKEPAHARTMPSSSPTHGFHSSFFSRNSMELGDAARAATPAASVREGSIFGHGGLRGSVKQEDSADRAPGSPPTHATPAWGGNDSLSFVAHAMDDDDAPPQETLSDVAHMQPRSLEAAGAASAGRASRADAAAARDARPAEAPLSERVVVVYGFPAALRAFVVEQFGSLGGLVSADDVDTGAAGHAQGALVPVRLTYAEPVQALHALHQTGKSIAGTCLIGVRWENDAMHEQSLVQGLDAPLLASAGAAAHAAAGGAAQPAAVPATPAHSARLPAKGTPAFGRPITKVDSPVAALAQPAAKSGATPHSPFRSVVHLGESLWRGSVGAQDTATAAPPSAPSGVLGRLADGLFGW
ncbi:hypothetical protein MCAP1_001914 [Malassezia caprae]|uniref:RRM Nup35-type domain-containing protein n=1 Tax=Malassezia caprae TaxID=1381934 RepID=A0AAF0E640_9BASI|nr:hypothetical protein MCAP1_001914 [Malassezia caprae]